MKRIALLLIAFVSMGSVSGQTSMAYRFPDVVSPADPVEVFLDLTTSRVAVAAGMRLIYDSVSMTLVTVEDGANIPATWDRVHEVTSVPGEVDVAWVDVSSTQATVTGGELLRMTFDRIASADCTPLAFGFNAVTGDPAIYPGGDNQYVLYISGADVAREAATTTSASGPAVGGFIRGNVSERSLHAVDIGDVVALVSMVFGQLAIGFDCDSALDTNGDGNLDVVDVVSLANAIFIGDIVIPPPFPSPGLLPSGSPTTCNESEFCAVRSVQLEWDAPTTNEDGTPIQDLMGHYVYWSIDDPDPCSGSQAINVRLAISVTLMVVGGEYYCFGVRAYDTSANFSGCSKVVCHSSV